MRSLGPLVIAILLSSAFAAQSQNSPPRTTDTTREIPSEEIFARFASRVLLLICDLSANEAKQGSRGPGLSGWFRRHKCPCG